MSFAHWIENETPATGAVTVYRVFVTLLAAAGATKPADSDGTTYSSSGAQVTTGASGTGGLGNNSAWVRVRLPNGKEYVLQRGTTDLVWRIKYSASAGFTGGSPGATRVPSATDEVTVFGGGTDASPTFSTWLAANAGYKLNGGADPVTPYPFWFGCIPNGGGTASGGFVHDPVSSPSASDQDPTMIYIGTSGGNPFATASIGTTSSATTASRPAGWINYNNTGSFMTIQGNYIASTSGGSVLPGAGGSNPHDGEDNTIPVIWWRPSAQPSPYGYKGLSRVMQWNPVTRSAGETFTDSTVRDRISYGDVNLPWSGTAVIL